VKTNLMRLRTLRRLIVGGGLSLVCVGVIHIAVVQYREAKAIERAIDALSNACVERGGCADLPMAPFDI